jgi:NADH:ubiquinone oxidoreductase subunit E
MTVEKLDRQAVLDAVQIAIEHHGVNREELIPILSEVNRTLGYLPVEALAEISTKLQVPKSQILSVATFYQMLTTKPRGKHTIQFCESAPCHVAGGQQVWNSLQDELELGPGETSSDGNWTLITTSCLGICAVGPVFLIDDDIFGNVTPEQIPEILARYR